MCNFLTAAVFSVTVNTYLISFSYNSIPMLNPHYCTVAQCGVWHREIPGLFRYTLTNACVESYVFTGLP